jgi:hypothetical protein
MTGRKNIKVIQESDSGRNLVFRDPNNGKIMSRVSFVKEIEAENYTGYHVRVIEGIKTPVSNPDFRESNNLD